MKTITNSEKETRLLGKQFSKSLIEGDVVLLEGPLGAGKTVFIKGIARGFGIKEKDIRSPSFTLIKEYETRKIKLYHIDLYRIKLKEELINLGYENYFYKPEGIALVEWGERVEDMLSRHIRVRIIFSGLNKRNISFKTYGYNRDKLKHNAKKKT